MSCSIGRTLPSRLKLFRHCDKLSQRFYCVSHPIIRTLDIKFHGGKWSSMGEFQLEQRRNLTVEGIREFNRSVYDNVVSSETSLMAKDLIVGMHDATGLPWWTTIMLTGAVVKTLIGFPTGLFQNYLGARLQLVKQEHEKNMKDWSPECLLAATRGRWSEEKKRKEYMLQSRRKWNELVVRDNCHPFKFYIMTWAQFPVWVFISYTLRGMTDTASQVSVPLQTKLELQTEGVFWCTNLMIPDTTLVLPTLLFLSTWLLVDINTLSKPFQTNRPGLLFRIQAPVFKLFGLLSFFISAAVPSSISLYWVTSVVFGLGLNLLFLSPRVRRFCQIPITSLECKTPYSNLIWRIKEKYTTPPKFLKKFRGTS